MLLKAVIDIDINDPTIKELNDLAFSYDLTDMTEVLMVAYKCYGGDNQQAMFIINDETYKTVIQTILTLAIVNFGSWKYEIIEIALPAQTTERSAVQFNRIYPAEDHKGLATGYLNKAKEIIAKYEKPDQNESPAE